MFWFRRIRRSRSKILLETINDHPTADAYNALGDLYARGPSHRMRHLSVQKLRCALDGQELAIPTITWASRFLTKGDRSRAAQRITSCDFDSNPIQPLLISPWLLCFRKKEG